jgi:putative hemolysin
LKILQIKPNTDGNVTEEEIKAFIREGTEGGSVQEIEQDIVDAFSYGDRKVNSLMTHRKSVVFLPLYSNKAKIKEYVKRVTFYLSGLWQRIMTTLLVLWI